MDKQSVQFIPFKADSEDAMFCYKLRIDAYIRHFQSELSVDEVLAGITALLPQDFDYISKKHPAFIILKNHKRIGFVILKKTEDAAEIYLIYLHKDYTNRGVGRFILEFIETYIRTNWKEVTEIFVDTIIPVYNGGFYRKMGFYISGEAYCKFPDLSVDALRYVKKLVK